jgi:hypothetical protein
MRRGDRWVRLDRVHVVHEETVYTLYMSVHEETVYTLYMSVHEETVYTLYMSVHEETVYTLYMSVHEETVYTLYTLYVRRPLVWLFPPARDAVKLACS